MLVAVMLCLVVSAMLAEAAAVTRSSESEVGGRRTGTRQLIELFISAMCPAGIPICIETLCPAGIPVCIETLCPAGIPVCIAALCPDGIDAC